MNCERIERLLDERLDGTLPPSEAEAFDAHCRACVRCRNAWSAAQRLQQSLAEQPIPEPSPGFEARVLERAARAGRTRRGFAAGFATAAALALMTWVLATLNPGGPEPVEGVRLAVGETRRVTLVFEVPRAIAGAEVTMELPEGVTLEGYGDEQVLRWQTDLAAGRNALTLPVRAERGGESELVARIRTDSGEQVFRVPLGADREPRAMRQTFYS